MKNCQCYVFVGLLLGLSTVASASKISTSGSAYGPASPVTNTLDGDLNEQNYLASFAANDEVFAFQINTDISNFTLILSSPVAFIADDTSNTPPDFLGFGALIDDGSRSCPAFSTSTTEPMCGPDPNSSPYNASSNLTGSDGTDTSVSFSVEGDGKGLVFFAVVPETAGTDQNGNLILNNLVTAEITSATPEPRLLPMLVLGLAGLLLFGWRRRLAKLA
jgi:hypothetical protein